MEDDISAGSYDNVMTRPTAQVDIAQFVEEVERFNCMTEPFAFLLYLWDDLRRWRYPVLTGCLWLLCNLACLILSQAAVFTLVALIVILIALVCLIQLHTRLLDKFLPVTTTTEFQDDLLDEHSAIQTIRDFKWSLLQMHEFICKCNQYLRYFYCLLKWDFTLPSLRFHMEVCFLLLCLVVCPTRWTAFLLTNWFFLATNQVYTGCRRRVFNFIEYTQGKRSLAAIFENQNQSNNAGPTQKECMNGGALSEGVEALGEDGVNSSLTDADKLSDTGAEGEDVELQPSSDSKPGMVARLMDLKRRRKIINT
ncbi:uncharacterized protein LOC127856883 isoform X2 [Dreissena polymorpha]|uniref:uncharacterized protein LOC127856883 isoform X2 n=1 Tax=Dreissena polymorpha TaxID=45954 RepID=UPI002264323F|nr:uncharacterized protein LOC127856883 isoform X2 [Dreissena polymorpha]